LHTCVCYSILLYQTYGLLVLYQVEKLADNEPIRFLIYFSGLQITPILILASKVGQTFRILNAFLTLHFFWLVAMAFNCYYLKLNGECWMRSIRLPSRS
jgi:hypothetical protein